MYFFVDMFHFLCPIIIFVENIILVSPCFLLFQYVLFYKSRPKRQPASGTICTQLNILQNNQVEYYQFRKNFCFIYPKPDGELTKKSVMSNGPGRGFVQRSLFFLRDGGKNWSKAFGGAINTRCNN